MSYIDYETILSPTFSAPSFANTLILTTNDPSDSPLDLSTPLSRVLFDLQEIDTTIDTLTTSAALPLLTTAALSAHTSTHLLASLDAQLAALTAAYTRLESDVCARHAAAQQLRLATQNLVRAVSLGRRVSRCLQLGRQLEAHMAGFSAENAGRRDAYRALVPAARTLLALKRGFAGGGGEGGEEGRVGDGEGLERVAVMKTLRGELLEPAERAVVSRAQQMVREFSVSSALLVGGAASANERGQQGGGGGGGGGGGTATPASGGVTFAQNEDTKAKTVAALTVLYLLSPTPQKKQAGAATMTHSPDLLVAALQQYLRTALTSSLTALARALATLPTLDRTLLEVSARCQNIVALEALLAGTKVPADADDTSSAPPPAAAAAAAAAGETQDPTTFLTPLLTSLDTASLASYFWRSLASALAPRVQEIIARGGVSARTLKTNRERVAEAVRACVHRGALVVGGAGSLGAKERVGGGARTVGNWEREAAVMVSAVVGALGR